MKPARFLRLLARLWWVPALVPFAVLLGVEGARWLPVPVAGGAAVLFVAGVVFAGIDAAGARAVQEHARHQREDHRFLCPRCLHFAAPHYACRSCGRPTDAVSAFSQPPRHCPGCDVPFVARGVPEPTVAAYCPGCRALLDLALYHERRVRVVAVLRDEDFQALAKAGRSRGAQPDRVQGLRCLQLDDGRTFTWVMNAAGLERSEAPLPEAHALRALEAVWLGYGKVAPLEVGQTVDRLFHQAGFTPGSGAVPRLQVRAARLDPPVERLLAPRFAAIDYRVAEARALLTRRR